MTKKQAKTAVKKTIKARTAGMKLFVAAGRPTKSDFIKLCGKKGPAMTWLQRAEHLGVATPGEAAQKFSAAKVRQFNILRAIRRWLRVPIAGSFLGERG